MEKILKNLEKTNFNKAWELAKISSVAQMKWLENKNKESKAMIIEHDCVFYTGNVKEILENFFKDSNKPYGIKTTIEYYQKKMTEKGMDGFYCAYIFDEGYVFGDSNKYVVIPYHVFQDIFENFEDGGKPEEDLIWEVLASTKRKHPTWNMFYGEEGLLWAKIFEDRERRQIDEFIKNFPEKKKTYSLQPGDIIQHYKGNIYRLLDYGISLSNKNYVVQVMYGNDNITFVRDYENFFAHVNTPSGEIVPRFKLYIKAGGETLGKTDNN